MLQVCIVLKSGHCVPHGGVLNLDHAMYNVPVSAPIYTQKLFLNESKRELEIKVHYYCVLVLSDYKWIPLESL